MNQSAHQPDYFLLGTVAFLVLGGLIILSSASVVLSQELFGQSYYYLKRQLLYSLPIGLIFFLISQRINYRLWQKFSLPLFLLSLVLLALVFVPGLGYGYGQTKRWLALGPFSLQPFELVKISFIFYLSALLAKPCLSRQKAIKQSLGPVILALMVMAGLLLAQPNLSALIIILLIAGLLYYLAGLPWRYLLAALFIALAIFLLLIKITPYRMNRLMVFLHPELDPQGIGYQINQALLSIGTGGLTGLGLGHSVQKWIYLPEVIGDSIFAIVAEELGFIGCLIIIGLFVLFAWRGLLIAKNAPDSFGYLLAAGITGWIFFQAFINIMAISGMIPLTGLPLPFISYGGSALVVALMGIGVLINISKQTS